jgi:DNA-binding LacI/PurR family transcriptional regulator
VNRSTTRVTLRTIAEALGVSVATVSNAYNRPQKLSPALRERVLAEAERLGYAGPDPAASRLRRGRAGVVGVLFPEALGYAFRDPGAVAFLRGLAAALEDAGLGVLLVPARDAEDPAPVLGAVVDGFVLFSLPDEHPLLAAALARGLPVVTSGGPRRDDCAFVGIDDRAAARAAAEHVLARGHRRLAVVTFRRADAAGGPGSRVTGERLEGFRDAIEAAGRAWDAVAVEEQGLNDRACGRAAGERLVALAEPPTAVLATSDELGIGVLEAAPGLAVVGFDDAGPAAEAGLTTVAQDLEGQGRAAGELLLGAGEWGEDPPPHVLVPTTVVARASTARPAR